MELLRYAAIFNVIFWALMLLVIKVPTQAKPEKPRPEIKVGTIFAFAPSHTDHGPYVAIGEVIGIEGKVAHCKMTSIDLAGKSTPFETDFNFATIDHVFVPDAPKP